MARSRSGLRRAARVARAFTVVELLVVMAIILVLAGLVLGTSSYVHNKGARSRAEAEIAAMSAALENYKADNGSYTNDPNTTDNLSARAAIDLMSYGKAGVTLFKGLSGLDTDGSPISGAKSYFDFKPQMLQRDDTSSPVSSSNPVTGLRDPFGNNYGYSTAGQAGTTNGYNPTFDLWSTGGNTDTDNPPNQSQWIKNW